MSDVFVGRTGELEWLADHLGSNRWVAVLGPPGVGKTRLAREYFRARGRSYPGGMFWAELRDVHALPGLLDAVRRAVGVSDDGPPESAPERLGGILRAHGAALIVLDDCSALVATAGDLLQNWLRDAPTLHVMVTSRVRPSSGTPAVLDVAPLSVPEGAEGVSESDAVRLLVARGRALNAQLTIRGNELALAGISRELGGLPLAIELAAARLRVMSPGELLAELREPDSSASFEAEQPWRQELAVALDLAWKGLAPWERAALGQLSAFRGGFCLDSVHAVVDLSRWDQAPQVVDVIAALQDKSLISRASRGSLARFNLLEPIRAFAEGRPDEVDRQATLARHAAHYRELSEVCSARIHSGDGPEMLARLGMERENLFAAARWALAGSWGQPEPETAIEILVGASHWALRNEPAGEFASLLDDVLARPDVAQQQTRGVAFAHLARAESRRFRGDASGSEQDLERSLATADAIGDMVIRCRALCARGALHMNSGRFSEAVDDYGAALSAAHGCSDRSTEIRALLDLAHIAVHEGDHAGARAKLRRAQTLAGAMDDRSFIGRIWSGLGHLAVEQDGGQTEAMRLYQRALECHRRLGDRNMEAVCRTSIGLVHHLAGRTQEARAAYRSALELCRRLGILGMESVCTGYLAIVELGEGDTIAAQRLVHEALEGTRRAGYGAMVGLLTAYDGAVHALAGNALAARQAFGEAKAQCPEGPFGASVTILEAYLEISAAKRAHHSGDSNAASEHAEGARRILAGTDAELVWSSADVRLAHACVSRALGGIQQVLGGAVELRVGPAGAWFKTPDGAVVDLRRRAILARVLAFLAEQREREPGGAASLEEILAAGWPGERVSTASGTQRVHTAVWTLRRLGGAELIARNERGYFINPAVSIRRATRPVPET